MADADHTTRSPLSRRSLLGVVAAAPAAVAVPAVAAAVAPALADGIEITDPGALLYRDWMQSTHDASVLGQEAARMRAELTARIGPRGLVIGTINLPDGRVLPIHMDHTDSVRRLLRKLPMPMQDEVREAFPAVQAALAAARDRWDEEADRYGLLEVERRAASARDRARALFNRLPTKGRVPNAS